MYHSITIGEKNTWDDWHLIAKVRPFFNPPKLKTKYIEIPGASGSIDVSQILTGYPLYSNREGSIDFTILNTDDLEEDSQMHWYNLYSEMMNYLHLKNFKAILEDEPDYYYEGQFSVTGYKPGDSSSNTRGTITVSYTLNPYKWAVQSSTEDWVWDTFNFEHGIIYPELFKDIILTGETVEKTLTFKELGYAPVKPVITCYLSQGESVSIRLERYDGTKLVNVSESSVSYWGRPNQDFHEDADIGEFVFYDTVKMTLTGNGKVSINFRVGRL